MATPKNVGQHNRSKEAISAQLKKANANGRAFEDAVSVSAREWRIAGIAKIRKSYAPSRTEAGTGGVGGAAPVDFTGELADGTKVAFECKNLTRTASYTHDKDRPHQLVYLRRVRHHGGLAFLLFYDSDLGVAFIGADLDTLAQGGAIPVRSVKNEHEFVAFLPMVDVELHPTTFLPVRLPTLLTIARQTCANFRVVKG